MCAFVIITCNNILYDVSCACSADFSEEKEICILRELVFHRLQEKASLRQWVVWLNEVQQEPGTVMRSTHLAELARELVLLPTFYTHSTNMASIYSTVTTNPHPRDV